MRIGQKRLSGIAIDKNAPRKSIQAGESVRGHSPRIKLKKPGVIPESMSASHPAWTLNGRTPIVFAILGLCLTIISGGWVIIQQSIDKETLPLKGQIETLTSIISDLKRVQEDRGVRISNLESLVKADQESFNTKLKEVETQFKASDQARNIQFANDLRFRTILWEKVFPGSRYPSDIQYYPEISTPNR